MNKEIAEETSLIALRASAKLNAQLIKIQENCSEEEFAKMQKDVGLVLGYLYTDIMEPIWKEHEGLRPIEMGGNYSIPPEDSDGNS